MGAAMSKSFGPRREDSETFGNLASLLMRVMVAWLDGRCEDNIQRPTCRDRSVIPFTHHRPFQTFRPKMDASGNNGSKKPKDLPFYQAPDHIKTSSKIISEAKSSLVRSKLRPISTKRPVTPQEGQRKLFGDQSYRDPSNRPPSAISVGSRHFDSESRPVSGTKLTPIEHKPRSSVDHEAVMAPKPPADPNRPLRRPPSRQRLLQHSSSIDSITEPSSPVRSRSGSLTDVSQGVQSSSSVSSVPTTPESQRRVHSGPKERTQSTEGRGEGDGSETNTRMDSRSGRRHRSRDRMEERNERVESGYSSDARESSASSTRGSSAGKSGSAGSREPETPEEALFYNTKIGPIMDEIATHIKDKDPERLTQLANELYSVLDDAKLLGKACKRRATMLKTIFKLLDVDSPRLLLALARLILALKVSGNNLTNICKLVFKVSREEKHDVYFLEANILELLIDASRTTDHLTSAEALVYCVGALKFLSGNTKVLKHLSRLNCVESMAHLLKTINKTNLEMGKANESLGHIMVQCTACLRNLADVSGTRASFLQLDILDGLCKVMEIYHMDGDLMLNISRIFSKLTMHTDCCTALSSQESHFRSFLHLLKVFQRKEDLIVRVSFIVGNLTAKNDLARTRLFNQPKALDILVNVLKYYVDQDCKAENEEENTNKGKTEDVLIKLVRVIANLSINEDIGPVIATNETCISQLEQILEMKCLRKSEELVLNTIATLNNLAFYNVRNSAIASRQIPLAQCLLKFLDIENFEGLAEATRVFGNLTRDRSVRDLLVQHKVDEMMVVLLDSGKREVVFTAVGVLINLMADEDKRSVLKVDGGVRKLVDVLRDFGRSDWQLASMVCQTFWNYSGRITSANACFGENEANELVELLLEYLDEDAAMDASLNPDFDEEMRDYIHDVWEADFCPVASQLLNRVEAHMSNFEPLEHPS